MTKEDAMSYINGNGTISENGDFNSNAKDTKTDAQVTATEDVVESDDKSRPETKDQSSKNANEAEAQAEAQAEAKAEAKATLAKANKYSNEEKSKHAFRQQKQKLKTAKLELDRKDKELKELRDRLSKYENMKAQDFKDESGNVNIEKYMDYRDSLMKSKTELDSREREQLEFKKRYAQEILEEKIRSNFDTDEDRSAYKNILETANGSYSKIHPEYGTNNFADLLLQEPEQTVAKYLSESEHAPLMLRHFIFKPESMLKIMDMTGEMNKMFALRELENRMVGYFNRQKTSKSRNLPNTGKAVVSPKVDTSADMWNRKWSAKDASSYIHKHR